MKEKNLELERLVFFSDAVVAIAITETVKHTQQLEQALKEIGKMIHQPHFKTKIGRRFLLKEIDDAINYVSVNGGKAVLIPS